MFLHGNYSSSSPCTQPVLLPLLDWSPYLNAWIISAITLLSPVLDTALLHPTAGDKEFPTKNGLWLLLTPEVLIWALRALWHLPSDFHPPDNALYNQILCS